METERLKAENKRLAEREAALVSLSDRAGRVVSLIVAPLTTMRAAGGDGARDADGAADHAEVRA